MMVYKLCLVAGKGCGGAFLMTVIWVRAGLWRKNGTQQTSKRSGTSGLILSFPDQVWALSNGGLLNGTP